jgi:polysaccharide export outer membrane protein
MRNMARLAGLMVMAGVVCLAAEEAKPVRTTYMLGPDDQIVLRVSNMPEISEKPVRIDLNGYIRLPLIGRVKASGKTIEQLETELMERLGEFLEEPDVAVSMTEFKSQPVSVIGAVNSPGVHQLQGRKTLVEILSMVGGMKQDAGVNATITRNLEWGRIPLPGATDDPSGQFSIAEVNLKTLIEGKHPEKNIIIYPHDVISIPRAEVVYVMGDVAKVGALVLSEGESISILQAVSSAGGLLRTAAAHNAKILRLIMGGPKRAELDVDVKKIMAGKANDQPLLAGDILFVPGSASKKAAVRAVEAAVQAGTMIITWGTIR